MCAINVEVQMIEADAKPNNSNEAAAEDNSSDEEVSESSPFSEFLESTPPSQMVSVGPFVSKEWIPRAGEFFYNVEPPDILLHCPSDICNGYRIFRYRRGDRSFSSKKGSGLIFLTYACSNCRAFEKMFSLYVKADESLEGECYKFGEYPPFGPPTPTRLLRLFGEDRDTFLRGRRCENQGLGVGAFAYYRRVVENHKNQILDEIIKVAEKVGAGQDMIEQLEAAKIEPQFSKALKSVKDAIPESLLINGQNPLTLLHAALSGGLHGKSDEECLELAQAAQVVLAELAERISQSLKDEAELTSAVSRLMQARAAE
jgi:hypothetical protein